MVFKLVNFGLQDLLKYLQPWTPVAKKKRWEHLGKPHSHGEVEGCNGFNLMNLETFLSHPRIPPQPYTPLKSVNKWQLSNEKNPGWLGYTGDEILPSYIGIIISHYKDPY